MKKILIFTSGNGKHTQRLISLFNEGNRVHTDFVITDITDPDFGKNFEEEGVSEIVASPEALQEKAEEIARELRMKGVDLIVTDGWKAPIPEIFLELANNRVLELLESDNAPLVVVRALEKQDSESRQEAAVVDMPKVEKPQASAPQTPDEEWAEALQMDFDQKRVAGATPPPVPEDVMPEIPRPEPSGQPDFHRNKEDFERRQEERRQEGWRRDEHRGENFEPMPPTYLIWSILATIFCCFIPGIVAIIFSSQVSTKYYMGDMQGARRASRIAQIWIIVSFILGVLSATLWVPFMIIGS